jgi:hypothetical protein
VCVGKCRALVFGSVAHHVSQHWCLRFEL